jgi:hypothetical protein
MNSISGPVSGIQSGLARLSLDATVIAQSVNPSGNGTGLTNAVVDSMDAQLQVEASAKALAVESQTIGSIIDTFA